MMNYLKFLISLIYNYKIYTLHILVFEIIYIFKYGTKFNTLKIFNSSSATDSIPCTYYILLKIKQFLFKKKTKYICDLGSGYGKVLFYLGYINNYKISGYELDKNLFHFAKINLKKKCKILNKNILKVNFFYQNYECFIINDPLKKTKDYKTLIDNITKIKKKFKRYLIIINIGPKKVKIMKKFKLVDKIIMSNFRNFFIFEI